MGLIDRLFGRSGADLPADKHTLLKTHRGALPAIVVVNASMTTPAVRAQFRWHLSIVVVFADVSDNGMPTPAANERVNQLEDQIEAQLRLRENAVFVSRITGAGRREFNYQLRDPKAAEDTVRRWVAATGQVREWSYQINFDPDWTRTGAAFDLLKASEA